MINNHIKENDKSSRDFSIGQIFIVLVFVCSTILIAGLKPKGFSFENEVYSFDDSLGLVFGEYGISFTNKLNASDLLKQKDSKGFSFEIVIKPAKFDDSKLKFILAFQNKNSEEQLIVAQWNYTLILMNGDDYSNEAKTYRIMLDLLPYEQKTLFLTVTSGPKGTHLFVNGIPVQVSEGLYLKIPTGNDVRILLGNSSNGKHSWQGTVGGVVFHGRILANEEIVNHYRYWKSNHTLSSAINSPELLWIFDGKIEQFSLASTPDNARLSIPKNFIVLEKKILERPVKSDFYRKSYYKDITINLMGFIPLGFLIVTLIKKSSKTSTRNSLLLSIIACFLISLLIEVLQVWLPSRSSHLTDLVTNTIGGLMGGIIYILLNKRKQLRAPD